MNMTWEKLKLILGALLWIFIGVAVYRLDYNHLKTIDLKSGLPWLLSLIILIFFQNELSVIKWHRLLKLEGLNVSRVHVRASLWSGLISNLVLPTSIFGDVQKFCYLRPLLSDQKEVGSKLMRSQFLDRMSVYTAFIFLSLLSIPGVLAVSDNPALLFKQLMISFLVLFSLFSLVIWIFPRLVNLYQFLSCIQNIRVMGISLLVAMLIPLKIYLASKALGYELDKLNLLLLSPFIIGAYLVPVGGSAFGAREVVLFLVASLLNLSSSEAFSASLLIGACIVFSCLSGAMVFLIDWKPIIKNFAHHLNRSKHAVMVVVTLSTLMGLHDAYLLAYALLYLFLVLRGLERENIINPANVVTSLRLLILPALFLHDASAFSKGFLLTTFVALDGVDGYVARRWSCTSLLGARYDMEVDALSVLFASTCLISQYAYPHWLILLGLWRYLYAFWRGVQYPHFRMERRSNLGRIIFVLTMLSLCHAFFVSNLLSLFLLSISVLMLSYSFLGDILFTIKRAKNEG